jgi:hypothetical protein
LSTSEKKQEERQQEEAKDAWAMGKNCQPFKLERNIGNR